MAKRSSNHLSESNIYVLFLPFIRDTCYKSPKHSKIQFMWFTICKLFLSHSYFLSLSFYSSSLVFSCWICLFSFVVDFDFYGCQRALKVAKRVTLHSIPLRLWRVFNSPVNRLQSRVANWNSAWGGDEKGQEEACFEAPFWMLLKVEKGKNKCCQCCWAGIINK